MIDNARRLAGVFKGQTVPYNGQFLSRDTSEEKQLLATLLDAEEERVRSGAKTMTVREAVPYLPEP